MNQMLWYTIILIPLTLLPTAFGAFGVVYFVAALALGLVLLWGVLRIRRTTQWAKPAWWVYKYSLLYLALLFVAMVVDRQLRAGG
jgi:protoheme IX farnesyltransferase